MLNFAIYMWKWYRVDKFECSIVQIANVSGYNFFPFLGRTAEISNIITCKNNSHLKVHIHVAYDHEN